MTGTKELMERRERSINNLLNNSKDKPYLVGFHNYMSNLSDVTIRNYLGIIRNFMNSNGKQPEDLTIDDYSSFMFSIKDKTSGYKVLVYIALKKFSEYLKISNRNESNPMQYVQKPRVRESQKTIEKREHGYLEEDEIHLFLQAIENAPRTARLSEEVFNASKKRDMAIVMTFLNTGMRASALYKLDLADIDCKDRMLKVTDKGDKVNTYYMNDILIDALKDYLEVRHYLDSQNSEALFLSKYGTRISAYSVGDLVRKYAKAIGRPEFSPHKLRATYGTMIYRKTKDIRLTQKAMKHSNIRTTELYIRGDSQKDAMEVANIMNNLISE